MWVIGEGALSAGMAYEALNNAGAMNKQLIVILNDNDMSIDRPVGAMSSYLSKLLSSKSYSGIRSVIKKISSKFPKPFMAKQTHLWFSTNIIFSGLDRMVLLLITQSMNQNFKIS